MRSKRFLATIAAGLGVIALVPVATAFGDDSGAPVGRSVEAVTALGTSFTYQGRLTDAGSPANGSYDIRFILYDAETAGASVGTTQSKEDVAVVNGLFSVDLDFGGAAWNGDARWVEIAVRPGTSAAAHTVLSPRQPISPTPYALYAKVAGGIAVPFAATGTTAGASTTGLVTITQAGTGIAVSGLRTSTDVSEFPGVLGVNSGGGAGVQGESNFTGAGVGVRGFAVGTDSVGGYFSGPTGIEIDGDIKVSGSNPAAFVLTVDTAGPDRNTCPGDGGVHLPDAAVYLTVDDPDAIVLITPINYTVGAALTWYPSVAPAWCPGITNRWVIFSTDGSSIPAGIKFNVLVIKQ